MNTRSGNAGGAAESSSKAKTAPVKAAPPSPKRNTKFAPASPKLGAKPASPRSSPKFSPSDPVKQEALALLQPALLKDSAPLKFSQFVSDRGAKCLIDLGLMSIIQDAAMNKNLTVQREGAMYVLVSLCSVVGRNGESFFYSNASYRYPYHAMSFDAVPYSNVFQPRLSLPRSFLSCWKLLVTKSARSKLPPRMPSRLFAKCLATVLPSSLFFPP